jgi:Ser/Thr protein kinase RdoA (MazF antagonist)
VTANDAAPSAPWLVSQIERHWSIGKITGLRRIHRGLVNKSFRIDTTSGSSWILRLYHPEITTTRIRLEHRLLQRLAAVGFPLSPRLVSPDLPPTWKSLPVPIDDHRHMALMTRLPGEDRYTWDSPPQNPGSAQRLGATLARYHQAVWGWSQGTTDSATAEIAVLGRLGTTLASSPEALASLASLTATLRDLDRRAWPTLTVHGDYHAANVRWTGAEEKTQICGIFDFEYADHNWRLYDVGMATAYLATRWGAGTDENGPEAHINHSLLRAFLDGYDKALGTATSSVDAPLPPLLAGELDALPHYLALAHLLTLEWALAPGTVRRLGAVTAGRYARHARSALEWLERGAGSIRG